MTSGCVILNAGTYTNECCSITLDFNDDHPFPRCPRCGRACLWLANDGSQVGATNNLDSFTASI
jgi:hypothetical protein